MNIEIPEITISYALTKTNGNQAELGRKLGYGRAYINELVNNPDVTVLPETAAWRFVSIFGEPESEQVA